MTMVSGHSPISFNLFSASYYTEEVASWLVRI